MLDIYDLKKHIVGPTHITGHTIDVAITPNRESYIKSIETTQLDLSHHFLVDFKIISEPNSCQLKTITFRNTRNVNMIEFNSDITEKLNALPPTNEMKR